MLWQPAAGIKSTAKRFLQLHERLPWARLSVIASKCSPYCEPNQPFFFYKGDMLHNINTAMHVAALTSMHFSQLAKP
jgi:hypothetical protein